MKQRVEPGVSQGSSDSRNPGSVERKRPPPLPAECNLEQDKGICTHSPPPIAEASATDNAEHDGNELVDSRWMDARDILDARKRKEIKVPWATRTALTCIAELDNTSEMVRWARGCGEPCGYS